MINAGDAPVHGDAVYRQDWYPPPLFIERDNFRVRDNKLKYIAKIKS
jgi:hypothetical protein